MNRTGVSLIALAIFFNLPFSRLAATFDYPDILRQPTEVILAAFTAGGSELIATWYAFALAAMLMVPVGMAHAFARGRMAAMPELAVSAAMIGALAGLLQAMGLLRWVLVVPGLAASGDTQGFALIHAYAGLGLGEHLGMLLTAGHVALVGVMQRREGMRWAAGLALATTVMIGLGAMEGPVLVLGGNGQILALSAVAGYLALSMWMVWSGLVMITKRFGRGYNPTLQLDDYCSTLPCGQDITLSSLISLVSFGPMSKSHARMPRWPSTSCAVAAGSAVKVICRSSCSE